MTNEAGLNYGGWLWKAERRDLTKSGVATSYIRTCRVGREPAV